VSIKRESLPSTIEVPGLGIARLSPRDARESAEVDGATLSYTCGHPLGVGGLGAPSVLLMLPRYTPLNLGAYQRHLAELWSELPASIERVRPRLLKLVAAEIAAFAHQGIPSSERMAMDVLRPLRLRTVHLFPDERYWVWWRAPRLLLKEGLLMTGLGLWQGNQCYQLELDTSRISAEIGGHHLFVTAARRMRTLGVSFDG